MHALHFFNSNYPTVCFIQSHLSVRLLHKSWISKLLNYTLIFTFLLLDYSKSTSVFFFSLSLRSLSSFSKRQEEVASFSLCQRLFLFTAYIQNAMNSPKESVMLQLLSNCKLESLSPIYHWFVVRISHVPKLTCKSERAITKGVTCSLLPHTCKEGNH